MNAFYRVTAVTLVSPRFLSVTAYVQLPSSLSATHRYLSSLHAVTLIALCHPQLPQQHTCSYPHCSVPPTATLSAYMQLPSLLCATSAAYMQLLSSLCATHNYLSSLHVVTLNALCHPQLPQQFLRLAKKAKPSAEGPEHQ